MMQTLLTSSPQSAAEFIRRGETVAFPTETVYGLGANALDESAVAKIFAAKGRPADNPLIVHLADAEQIKDVTREVNAAAKLFIENFFPGALTLVLPKAERVPGIVTAGLYTVGVRVPAHDLAREFLRACALPVAAPSANLSGRPSPTTWQAVQEDLDGRIACILQDGQTQFGLESTVVDCTGEVPLVLRAGAVTLEQLRAVEPSTRLLNEGVTAIQTATAETADAAALQESYAARSPGLRHKHYTPRARVVLVESLAEIEIARHAAYIGISAHAEDDEALALLAGFKLVKTCRNVVEYAHELFAFFRRADTTGANVIYCRKVAEIGLGVALMDRLRRAAE